MVALDRAAIPESTSAEAPPSNDAIPLRLRRYGGSPRQVLTLTVIGTVFLAMFASHDLASWLDRMGDGPILGPVQRAAANWDSAMAALGFTRPVEALRSLIEGLQDWNWRS